METSNSNGPNSTGPSLFEPVLIFMFNNNYNNNLQELLLLFWEYHGDEYSTYYYWLYALSTILLCSSRNT